MTVKWFFGLLGGLAVATEVLAVVAKDATECLGGAAACGASRTAQWSQSLGEVEMLEEYDAAATRVDLLQRQLRSERTARRPFVFYISPPKTGTTSFASFLNEYLRIPTLHDSGEVYRQVGYDPRLRDDGMGPHPPLWEPEYAQILRELNATKLRSYMSDGIPAASSLGFPPNTNYQAFADAPWPFLFKWLDQTYPDSKFVFWERNVDEWVISFKDLLNYKNFAMELTPGEEKWRRRWKVPSCRINQLAFAGSQDNCSHFWTPADTFKRAYEGHVRAVRSYFSGNETPADRKSRFLDFDLTGPTAAAQLCEFLELGQQCDDLSSMPHENEK